MSAQVAISVVVPTYNEEKLIAHCLTSLKKQQFIHPYEIIVINNNSSDTTESIVRTFGVKIFRETKQGVVYARQRGLDEAQGEIVAGADADCIYPETWLQQIYDDFQTDPQIIAVGGPVESEKNPFWGYLSYRVGFWFFYKIYQVTGFVTYLGAFNFAFRRKKFLDLGGYRTYLDFGGDEWDPLTRLRKAGKVIFDPNLKIHLSLRRYRVGIIKFIFVHLLYYYTLNYILAKIFKRTLIHAKPVRDV